VQTSSLLNKNYTWFYALAISVFLIFFAFRPLNSPQYRIIVADGLGYYSYLPAQFIYHDTELKFEWFDKVFEANYDNHLFEKPTQNFMVKYGDRMINLYYPGQSLLQAPFFFAAHLAAKLFQYPADGFSLPYQLAMGISALFYTLLGVLFCHKLLFHISHTRSYSIFIPLLVFFGTNLFTYSIFAGCYTHAYSFCFLSLSLYFSERFFNSTENKLYFLQLLLLAAITVLTLRPLNGILLISVLYFFKPVSWRELFQSKKINYRAVLLILLIGLILVYSIRILYTQTHTLLANTYTIGRFYFDDWSHVFDNFFGFQNGILWYTPLIFLSFFTLFFVGHKPRLLVLLTPVFLIIVLYSLWFYWNIVNRTLVDFTAILAILLYELMQQVVKTKQQYRLVLLIALFSVPVYQLKAYQLRQGILNSNYTYWKYYFKNFLTLKQIDVYPVDPKTILKEQTHYFDFENETSSEISTNNAFEGIKCVVLNKEIEYAATKSFRLPVFLEQKGFKKVKLAFWFYRSENMKNVQLILSFGKKDSVSSYHPFYINESTSAKEWELKEFGMDLPAGLNATHTLTIYFWNPDKQNEAYIDNLKLVFILKDGSDEIVWR